MTQITKVLAVPATGAYYYEDLSALQADPVPIDARYTAKAVTSGFNIVREVSEAVSVGLILDNEQVVWGDCVGVAYSGKAGRDAAFRAAAGATTVERIVGPALEGREITSFRELVTALDTLTETVEEMRPISVDEGQEESQAGTEDKVRDPSRRALLAAAARLLRPLPDEELQDGSQGFSAQRQDAVAMETVTVTRQLHRAVQYGVSQALLQAVALTRGITMAEVIADEWELPLAADPIPIHAQSGSERYLNTDKMIVRRVASLPHALVDNIPEQVGEDGTKLTRYLRWIKERIETLGGEEYQPVIHLDVHGALGKIFDNNLGLVLGHLFAMNYAAQPYPLRIESPLILESRAEQIEAMQKLRKYVQFRKLNVQLVVDEWANTLEDIRAFLDADAADMIQVKMPDLGGVHHSVEAVLACKSANVGAFLGGSCAETDLAARVAVHVALATRPDIVMAKPGMGVDEAVSLVQNEMARTLAWIRIRAG